jgi:hypothetical protein
MSQFNTINTLCECDINGNELKVLNPETDRQVKKPVLISNICE